MDERAIDALLTRVQPVAPPASLRRRVLAARPVRLWPWAAAAGLLAAASIPVSSQTERLLRRASSTVAPPAGAAAVEDLTAWLGGTEEARRFAVAEIRRIQQQLHEEASSER